MQTPVCLHFEPGLIEDWKNNAFLALMQFSGGTDAQAAQSASVDQQPDVFPSSACSRTHAKACFISGRAFKLPFPDLFSALMKVGRGESASREFAKSESAFFPPVSCPSDSSPRNTFQFNRFACSRWQRVTKKGLQKKNCYGRGEEGARMGVWRGRKGGSCISGAEDCCDLQ